jgi:hypothetical protein
MVTKGKPATRHRISWLGFSKRCIAIPMAMYSRLTVAGPKEARKATLVVVDHHDLRPPAGGRETRHQVTSDVAYLRHTYTTVLHAKWGRREGGGGVVETQLVTHHDGHLRASADARVTGSTAESGGDGVVGETRARAKMMA